MEHRKFGYIRVSSKDQNEGRQLEAMRKMGINVSLPVIKYPITPF